MAITFAWDPNTEPDVNRYRLYWSENSTSGFTNFIEVFGRLTTNVTIPPAWFKYGKVYYAYATALNTSELESLPSNIVTWTNVGQFYIYIPSNFRITNFGK